MEAAMAVDVRSPVRQFDVQTGTVLERDPFEAYSEFHESEPFWCEDHGGFWVFTRYDQCRQIMQDARTFSKVHSGVPFVALDEPLFNACDPPDLQKLRAIVLPLMTPERIDPLEPAMKDVCRTLIAEFKDRGQCELISDFARKYPIAIFGELFGLPAGRREEFRNLAETFLHDTTQRQAAWSSIREVVRQELEDRRRSPRDDMLSGIAHGRVDGSQIDVNLAVNVASTVFLGGLDTLPSNIGWTFRYLAEHPEARQRLIEDNSTVPGAVEEFFRVFPSVPKTARRATRDLDFHGVHVRAGDHVVGLVSVANQDSAEFAHPLSLDFDREANRHMTFAVGAHRCLGSHLARHELGVALQEWHAAIPDYRVAPDAKITYSGGVFAMRCLPLRWDVSRLAS